MIHLRNYVVGRIDRFEHKLQKARENYQRSQDVSWAARAGELQLIVNELKLVLDKINSEIEFNF